MKHNDRLCRLRRVSAELQVACCPAPLTSLQLWLQWPCEQRMGQVLMQFEQSSSLGWQVFVHRWPHRRSRPQGCLQGMCSWMTSPACLPLSAGREQSRSRNDSRAGKQ